MMATSLEAVPVLETERLLLRIPEPADAGEFVRPAGYVNELWTT